MRCVIFSSLSDDDTCSQTADDGERQSHPVLNAEEIEDSEGRSGNQDSRNIRAKRKRVQQILHRSALLCTYEIDAEDAQEHTYSGYEHRCDDSSQLHVGHHGKSRCSKSSSGEYRSAIALIQVSSHASHVTHIIAHIISDSSRITGIILRDVSLNLSYDICSHISSLSIDTTTDTSEECLCRCSHTEGQHRRSDGDECHLVAMIE